MKDGIIVKDRLVHERSINAVFDVENLKLFLTEMAMHEVGLTPTAEAMKRASARMHFNRGAHLNDDQVTSVELNITIDYTAEL